MPVISVLARFLVAAGLAAFSYAAVADNFVVNDGGYSVDVAPGNGVCADSGGKCTLNAAIMEGNVRSGSHTITFTVPVVTLNGNLMQMRAPFTITGTLPLRTTLNGYNGVNHFSCFDLIDTGDIPTGHFNEGANGSTIANMVIVGCNGNGISANGHGSTFINNFIGVANDGLTTSALLANSGSGISVGASRVYSQVTSQFLLDTYALFPVQPVSYADIATFASQLTTVLANAQLGPVLISGNVISGNGAHGVEIFSQNIAGVFVTLNMIGTDVTGNIAVPNAVSGVRMVGEPFANMIGPDNVISGNLQQGIQIDAGNVSLPNFIMGNRVGLASVNPGADIGNGQSGITVDTKPDTSVGHVNPSGIALIIGPGNVIADNKGANNPDPDVLGADSGGILVTGASKGIKIRGNTIGVGEFPIGTPVAGKSYGNAGDGIIVTVSDTEIGGSGSGDGNVVAANGRHGILIKGSSVAGTKVIGNSIGVHPGLAGNLAIGNGADGIHNNGASTGIIGGTGASDANTIAGNGRNGIAFRNGSANNGWGTLVQRNKIYGNAKGNFLPNPGTAIDLEFTPNAPNVLHGEFLGLSYAQLDQAQPVICTGAPLEPAACAGFTPPSAGSGTSLDYTILTHGPANFRMEFFKVDSADTNTATTMTFLGEQTITTNGSGVPNSPACPGGRCTASVAGSAAGGRVVMTATDITDITDQPGGGWMDIVKCLFGITSCKVNNTSEFSNTALPSIGTSTAITTVSPSTSVFGQTVSVTATVTAAGGPAPTGTVVVNAGASSCNAVLGSPVGSASSGTCALSPNLPVGGPVAVTASFAAQNGFLASASSGPGNGSATVNKANTTTAITADTPDPSVVNTAYAVSASVTVTSPGAGTPAGSITVSDGTDSCVITLPSPSCNLTSTTTGAKNLVATYNGDASFNGSVSPSVPHQVSPAGPTPTTTAVTLVTPSPAVYGQTVAVTVQVTASSGALAPTGGVVVTAGSSTCNVTLAPVSGLVAGGSCNLAPSPAAQVAPYTVSAAYAGNASFAGSVSAGAGNGSLTVNKASTTTTITADTPDPSNVNAAYAVSVTVAAVSPGQGAPTGAVTVSDGTDNCVIALPAPSCNLTSTTSGAKTLVATYAGDANFTASVSPGAPHQVNPGGAISTTTAVTQVNPGTSVFGQAVSVTVQVTAGSGAVAPDGPVTITAGGSTCNVTLAPVSGLVAGGSCNLAPPPAAQVGAYTVTASYAGNATFAASSSSGAGNGSLTVNKASTTTTITADTPDPSNQNAAYTVAVTVAAVSPGQGTPLGTVTVSDGTDSCTITLPAPSCSLTSTTAGGKTLVATYAGNANFNGSVSPGAPHTVNPGGSTPTTTVVSAVTPSTAVYGQTVNVSVQVTAGSGAVAPDGSVTITAGASACTTSLVPQGGLVAGATCPLLPQPAAGAYTVTASYAGTATFAASTSSGAGNGSLTVNKAATSLTVSDAPDPTSVGVPYTVTAVLSVTAPGAGTPTGTISVGDGTDSCTITLPGTTCNLTSTTGGAKTLTAIYAGDANFAASSATTAHTVSVVTSFTGTTVAPGVTGTVTLTGGGASCSLVNPQFIAVAPLTPPNGVSFPFGLFDFNAAGCTIGGTITIQIVYSQPLPAGTQYWKYGPTPGDLNPHWYQMPGANVAGNTVTFSITDGGIGDDDVTANGVIVDQGGPGNPGGGSGASLVAIPTLGEMALALLALMLASMGALRLRRRI